MHSSVWKWLHNDTLERIANFLAQLLSYGEVRNCDDVVLVGGFSQSFFLTEYLEKCFPHIRFFRPSNPHLTVVRGLSFSLSLSLLFLKNKGNNIGALWWASKRKQMKFTKANKTYGFAINEKYSPLQHENVPSFMDPLTNSHYVRGFQKLITKEEDYKEGHV